MSDYMILVYALPLFGVVVPVIFFILQRDEDGIDRNKANTDIAKIKKADLLDEFQKNNITKEEYDELEEDIVRTLSMDLIGDNDTIVDKKNEGLSITKALVSLALIPVVVFSILFSGEKLEEVVLTQEQEVEKFVRENPDSYKGWMDLGTIYSNTGRIKKSIEYYEKAYKINSKDADLLVLYASVLLDQSKNKFTKEVVKKIKESLMVDSENHEALYLAGYHAISLNRPDMAYFLWSKAMEKLPEGSKSRSEFEILLKELRGENDGGDVSSKSVIVELDLSNDINIKNVSNDFLMVYVLDPDGTRVPVAIKKIYFSEFTGSIELTDANSIMPQRKLSSMKRGVVVVRLSKSGLAKRQLGDVQSKSEIFNLTEAVTRVKVNLINTTP